MKHACLIPLVALPLMLAACGPAPAGSSGNAAAAPAINADFACSGVDISVTFQDETATMRTGGREYALRQVVTASGAKYQADAEPETSFWNKGDGGTLMLEGVEHADCVKTGG